MSAGLSAAETSFLGADPGLERLYDNVQAMLSAASIELVKMAVWNTIEEFSIRSTWFRAPVNWFLPPGISTVTFTPYDANFNVAWVLGNPQLPRWRVDPPATLVDLGDNSGPRFGTVVLALKPVSLNATLPPDMFSNWFETFMDGTFFRLYALPGRAWSNPKLAEYYGRRFRQDIARARDIATRGFGAQSLPPRFPYFAHGRASPWVGRFSEGGPPNTDALTFTDLLGSLGNFNALAHALPTVPPVLAFSGHGGGFWVDGGGVLCVVPETTGGGTWSTGNIVFDVSSALGHLPLAAPAAGGFWNNGGVVCAAQGPAMGPIGSFPVSQPAAGGWNNGGVICIA